MHKNAKIMGKNRKNLIKIKKKSSKIVQKFVLLAKKFRMESGYVSDKYKNSMKMLKVFS